MSEDESLEDSASLPDPDVIIVDIIEDLRTALEQLEEIAGDVSVADEVQRQLCLGYPWRLSMYKGARALTMPCFACGHIGHSRIASAGASDPTPHR